MHRLLEEKYKNYKYFFKYENWKQSENFHIKRIGINACKWDDKNKYFKYFGDDCLDHLFKNGKEILVANQITRTSEYNKVKDSFKVGFDWFNEKGSIGGRIEIGEFKNIGKIHEEPT